MQTIKIDAVFEGGVFRPATAVELKDGQQVSLTVRLPEREWPADTAAIYHEIADEDRELAEKMQAIVAETWPVEEQQA